MAALYAIEVEVCSKVDASTTTEIIGKGKKKTDQVTQTVTEHAPVLNEIDDFCLWSANLVYLNGITVTLNSQGCENSKLR